MRQLRTPCLCSKSHPYIVTLSPSNCSFFVLPSPDFGSSGFFITLGVKNEFQPNLNFMAYPTLNAYDKLPVLPILLFLERSLRIG